MSDKFPCEKVFNNTIDPSHINKTINPQKKVSLPLPKKSNRKFWPDDVEMRIRSIKTDSVDPKNNELKNILEKYNVSFNEKTYPSSEGYIELKPKRNTYMSKDVNDENGFGQLESKKNLESIDISIRDKSSIAVKKGKFKFPMNFILSKKRYEEVPYKKNNMTYYLPGTPTWLYQRSSPGNQPLFGGTKINNRQIPNRNTKGINTNNFEYFGDTIDPDLLKWVNSDEQESWRKIMHAFYKTNKENWPSHKSPNSNSPLQIEILEQICNNKQNNWGKGNSKCGGKGNIKYIIKENIDKNGESNIDKLLNHIEQQNIKYITEVEKLRETKYEKWGGICASSTLQQKSIADKLCKRIGFSGGNFSKPATIPQRQLNDNGYENFLEAYSGIHYPVYGKKVGDVREGMPTYIKGSDHWGIKYRLRPASEHKEGEWISKKPRGNYEGFFEVKHYGISKGTRFIDNVRKFTAFTPSDVEFKSWKNIKYPINNPTTNSCTLNDIEYGINTSSEIKNTREGVGNSWKKCQTKCKNNATCKYFTLYGKRWCHLFKDNHNMNYNKNTISGAGDCNDIKNEKLYPYLIRSKSFLHDWGPVVASLADKLNNNTKNNNGGKGKMPKFSADWANSMGNSICKSLGFETNRTELNIIRGEKHMKYANTIELDGKNNNRGSNYSRKAMSKLTHTVDNSNNTYQYGDINWRSGNNYYNLAKIYCDPSKVLVNNYYDTKKGLSGCKVWKNVNGHNYIPGEDDGKQNTATNDKAIWVECAGKKNRGVSEYGNKDFMKNVDDGLALENVTCEKDTLFRKSIKNCKFNNAPWIAGGGDRFNKSVISNVVEKDGKIVKQNGRLYHSNTTCNNNGASYIKCHGNTYKDNVTKCRGNKGEKCNILCKDGYNYETIVPINVNSKHNNYCRNPGGKKASPWCYTKDPSIKWAPCAVWSRGALKLMQGGGNEFSDETYKTSDKGESYRGKQNNWIKDGKQGECAPWVSNEIHSTIYSGMEPNAIKLRKENGMDSDNKRHLYNTLTCKFKDEKYEWLDEDNNKAGECGKLSDEIKVKGMLEGGLARKICTLKNYNYDVFTTNPLAPYTHKCYKNKGEGYIGDVNTSNSNKECVPWNDKKIPNNIKSDISNNLNSNNIEWKSFQHDSFNKQAGIPSHNKCRSLTKDKPWCFVRKQDCYKPNRAYFGDKNIIETTIKGIKYQAECLNWKDKYMLVPNEQLKRLKMDGNKCRVVKNAPDGIYRDDKPWCYVDPNKITRVEGSYVDNSIKSEWKWGYCNIGKCEDTDVEKEDCDLQINKCERMPKHEWVGCGGVDYVKNGTLCKIKDCGASYSKNNDNISGISSYECKDGDMIPIRNGRFYSPDICNPDNCQNQNPNYQIKISDDINCITKSGRINWDNELGYKKFRGNQKIDCNGLLRYGNYENNSWTPWNKVNYRMSDNVKCNLSTRNTLLNKESSFKFKNHSNSICECRNNVNTTETYKQCQKLCQDTEKCNSFTWMKHNHDCHLFPDIISDPKSNMIGSNNKCNRGIASDFIYLNANFWLEYLKSVARNIKYFEKHIPEITYMHNRDSNRWIQAPLMYLLSLIFNKNTNRRDKNGEVRKDWNGILYLPLIAPKGTKYVGASEEMAKREFDCKYILAQKHILDNLVVDSLDDYMSELRNKITYYRNSSSIKSLMEGKEINRQIYMIKEIYFKLKKMIQNIGGVDILLRDTKSYYSREAENNINANGGNEFLYGLTRTLGGDNTGSFGDLWEGWKNELIYYSITPDIAPSPGKAAMTKYIKPSLSNEWYEKSANEDIKDPGDKNKANITKDFKGAVAFAMSNVDNNSSVNMDAITVESWVNRLKKLLKRYIFYRDKYTNKKKWEDLLTDKLNDIKKNKKYVADTVNLNWFNFRCLSACGYEKGKNSAGTPPKCKIATGAWKYCPPTDSNASIECTENNNETISGPKYCEEKIPRIISTTELTPVGELIRSDITCSANSTSSGKINHSTILSQCSSDKKLNLSNCNSNCPKLTIGKWKKALNGFYNNAIVHGCDSNAHGDKCKVSCSGGPQFGSNALTRSKINNRSADIHTCDNGVFKNTDGKNATEVKCNDPRTPLKCSDGTIFDHVDKVVIPKGTKSMISIKPGTSSYVNFNPSAGNQRTFEMKTPYITAKVTSPKPGGSNFKITCKKGYQIHGKYRATLKGDGEPYNYARTTTINCVGNNDTNGLTSTNCFPAACRNIKSRENMDIKITNDEFVECGKPKPVKYTYNDLKITSKFDNWGNNITQAHDDYYHYHYPKMPSPGLASIDDRKAKIEFRLRPKEEYHEKWYGKSNDGKIFRPNTEGEGHLEFRINGDPTTRVKSQRLDVSDPDHDTNGILTEYRIQKSGWRPVTWPVLWSDKQGKWVSEKIGGKGDQDVINKLCNIMGYGSVDVDGVDEWRAMQQKGRIQDGKPINIKYSWGDKKISQGSHLNIKYLFNNDLNLNLSKDPFQEPFLGDLNLLKDDNINYKDNSIWLSCTNKKQSHKMKSEKYCDYPSTLVGNKCVTLKTKCENTRVGENYTGQVNIDICNDNGYIWYPPKSGEQKGHCSTKDYLKHGFDCPKCKCKPNHTHFWVPFSIQGKSLPQQNKFYEWRLMSTTEGVTVANTKNGLASYVDGRATYILPWSDTDIKITHARSAPLTIRSSYNPYFKVSWNIANNQWQITINYKDGDYDGLVLFAAAARSHLPPKNGWVPYASKIEGGARASFIYPSTAPENKKCNKGLYEMRCVPSMYLMPDLPRFDPDFLKGIPKTISKTQLNDVFSKFKKDKYTLKRKWEQICLKYPYQKSSEDLGRGVHDPNVTKNACKDITKNICKPGYKFNNVTSIGKLPRDVSHLGPIEFNPDICADIKCNKINTEVYESSDPCGKGETSKGSICKIRCRPEIIDYRWDAEKKQCINQATGKPVENKNSKNCKRTIKAKKINDENEVLFTCGTNAKFKDQKQNLLENSKCTYNIETCNRKGYEGGHIINDTIPTKPEGDMNLKKNKHYGHNLKKIEVKPDNNNKLCGSGDKPIIYPGNKKYIFRNPFCYEITSSNINMTGCKKPGEFKPSIATGTAGLSDSNCLKIKKTITISGNHKDFLKYCTGDTIATDSGSCYPKNEYRLNPNKDNNISEKRIFKNIINFNQMQIPWYADREDDKTSYCINIKEEDIPGKLSETEKKLCKGRKMKVESDAPECYNLLSNGEDYRGEQNKVYNSDGTTTQCLNWSESNDERYKSLDGNYCRNPGGTLLGRSTFPNEPWCFTKKDTKTPCGINKCNYKTIQKEGIIEMRKKAGDDTSWKPICVNNIEDSQKNNLVKSVCKNIGYDEGTFQEAWETKEYAYEHKPFKKWISEKSGHLSEEVTNLCKSDKSCPATLGWTPHKDNNKSQYLTKKPYCPYFRTEDRLNPEKMENTINKAKKYCNTRADCGGFDVYERDEYSGKDTNKFPHICFWNSNKKNEYFKPESSDYSDIYIKQDKKLSGMETIYREYYPKNGNIFDIEENQKEFWPGYTKTIDIPDNSNWGIKIRLVNLSSSGKGDIELKLYGIAKDPTENSNNLLAYTEDLEEYNYWRNLKYEKGHEKEGELKYAKLVWKKNKSRWNKLSLQDSKKKMIVNNLELNKRICASQDKNQTTSSNQSLPSLEFKKPYYGIRGEPYGVKDVTYYSEVGTNSDGTRQDGRLNCGDSNLSVCETSGKYKYESSKINRENGHPEVLRGDCDEEILGWKPYRDKWQKSDTIRGSSSSPYFPEGANGRNPKGVKIIKDTIKLAQKFCDRKGNDCVGFIAYTYPTSSRRTVGNSTRTLENHPWISFHSSWNHEDNYTINNKNKCGNNKYGIEYVKNRERDNGIHYLTIGGGNKIMSSPNIEDTLNSYNNYNINNITCGTSKNSYYFNNRKKTPKCSDNNINNCEFSSDDNNTGCPSSASNKSMYIKCTGPETLYDNKYERTICSGKNGEKCLFTCKNNLKANIGGKLGDTSTSSVNCSDNKFVKGKCDGVKCNTRFFNEIVGAKHLLPLGTGNTIKGSSDVNHGTEYKLVCDDNYYVSGENKFICNNGKMNNLSINCRDKVCSDIDMSDSSLKAYKINKGTSNYILRKSNFNIPVTCADNYKGKAIATPCNNHGEPWTLSGCKKMECKSREKNVEDIKKMKEDIEKKNKRRISELQEIFFKLGINNHETTLKVNKKTKQLNRLVLKRNCARDESLFKGNEGVKKFIRPWKSKIPDNFNIDLLRVECDKKKYTDIKVTEEDKQSGVTTETKILRQKNIDERNVLQLYKELKNNEKAKEELINRVFTNTKDIKLKNRYNELKDEIKLKEEDIYIQPNGYTIYSENDLNMESLDVKVECAEYYKGVAKLETCDKDQSNYKLKGCKIDLKHPHICSDKCSKEDIESGKCKSSMIDHQYGDTVGNCGISLIQGETCSPKCKPGYFLKRKTKCELKDGKGVIIPAKCSLFKKKEQKTDEPRIYKSSKYTDKGYQGNRLQNMQKANKVAFQKKKKP